MNKGELIDSVANRTGESKRVVEDVLNTTIEEVRKAGEEGRARVTSRFRNLGTSCSRSSHRANPRTGEEIKIKATKVPAFKPGAELLPYERQHPAEPLAAEPLGSSA